jgi:hypothetical protein
VFDCSPGGRESEKEREGEIGHQTERRINYSNPKIGTGHNFLNFPLMMMMTRVLYIFYPSVFIECLFSVL